VAQQYRVYTFQIVYQNKKMLAKYCVLALVLAAASANVIPAERSRDQLVLSSPSSPIVIDGINNTVALTLDNYFHINITEIFEEVVEWIAKAIDPPPTADIDYFKVIEANVRKMVGDYVNQHNIDQILVWRKSLADLLVRYSKAPKSSATYTDKNKAVNAFHTLLQTNSFLYEAMERPDSMMLYFADIAAMDIGVLRDVALNYSTTAKTSMWWVDLDDMLAHYISYGTNLTTHLVAWRKTMVECDIQKCKWFAPADLIGSPEFKCYDVYTVIDKVAKLRDVCKAVHGEDPSCDHTCDNYMVEMNDTVQNFIDKYLGKPMEGWKNLKKVSSVMAAKAKNGH